MTTKCYTWIAMENEAQKILTKLITKHNISKETLAVKFGVCSRTIERWMKGENRPSLAVVKLLRQIYNGYAKRKKGVTNREENRL